MSIDFNAAFALGPACRGLDGLRDELAREPAALSGAVEHYRNRWRVHAWTIEQPDGEMGRIIGPGGFALTISPRAALLYHLLRFSHFTGVESERDLLRGACHAIASIVGSPRAIYMHELLPNGFHDGKDLDGIEATLRAGFGEPAPTFAALHEADHYAPGCWFIDTFADLR